MSSSYSTRLRLELQADGENDTTWGDRANTVFELIDEARGGYLSKSIAGVGTVTLTANNGTSDEARQAVLELTGVLTGNVSVVVPTAEFWWMVKNSTTGSFSVTVKTSAGTGVVVTQGKQAVLFCDGTNVVEGPDLSTLMGSIATGSIADDAVTLAKLENGTQGDILYYGASGAPTRLSAGTSGQFLKTQGAAANPTWATVTTIPPGVVNPYAGSTAPTGWLLCGGQAVSRTTYADLFAIIGTTYGTGDGSTTFNLPDLQGRVVAGKDDMSGTSANRLTAATAQGVNGDTLGATGGEEAHTQTEAEMADHDHLTVVNSSSSVSGGSTSVNSSQPIIRRNDTGGGDGYSMTATGGTANAGLSSPAGSGDAFNVVQPTIILNYIIKT